jgi:hypothetical protein
MLIKTISTAAALALAAGVLIAPLDATDWKRPSFEVIASGLDNPRGLTFGPDRALYVAEAGRGGDGKCITNGAGQIACFGYTGAITRISDDRTRRFISGLPSLAAGPAAPVPGAGAAGPHDVLFDRWGHGVATIGLGADPNLRADLGPGGARLARLLHFHLGGGYRFGEDLGAYEIAANPAGGTIDSNPFGLGRFAGNIVVADAGGNGIIQADDGVLSTFAVFPNVMVPPAPGAPPIPMQPVPTSVAEGPDGALYVGQLTGFPFPVGGASVFRVAQGSAPEVFAGGFTNIIDIAFDRTGALYVLEIAHNGLRSGNPVGALVRVTPDGQRKELFPGALISPGGMAIGRDGSIYVTRFASLPDVGDVVRIQPE